MVVVVVAAAAAVLDRLPRMEGLCGRGLKFRFKIFIFPTFAAGVAI